ncbi:hypothetical protein F1559_003783 [Cyanidiococcus yangmingshanensis]|uniref:Tetraspanin n=1 Tax=Cyanidiococcus yangmingshanensis TaxID=2690220 RepID=A0A7J7IP50_9RHOD|nr:hypothetical protein F1559_003783 [Cyanidiococcus yangmingshanensis]
MACGCSNSRGANVFHALFLLLLSGLGLALVGLGIWATVKHKGLNLDFQGWYHAVTRTGVAAIVVGGVTFLICLLGFTLLCRTGKCSGTFFRIIYALAMVILAAVLIFVGIFSIFLALGPNGPSWVQSEFHDAWLSTVKNQPSVAILQQLRTCTTSPQECPTGCSSQSQSKTGCYQAIMNDYRQWAIPVAVISLVAGVLALFDLGLLCCIGPVDDGNYYYKRSDYYSRRARV